MRNEHSLLENIRFELTNYENSTDAETTDEEWKDVFYDLLCRVVEAAECGEAVFEEPSFLTNKAGLRRCNFCIISTVLIVVMRWKLQNFLSEP